MRMRHIVICALPRSIIYFSTLSHKRHDFRDKSYVTSNVCLGFIYSLRPTFQFLRRIQRDTIINVRTFHVKNKFCSTDVSKSIVQTLQSLFYRRFEVYCTDVTKSVLPTFQCPLYRRYKFCSTDVSKSVLPTFQCPLYRRYKFCSTDVSKSIVQTLQGLFYRRFNVHCTDVTRSVVPTFHSLFYRRFEVYCTDVTSSVLPTFQNLLYRSYNNQVYSNPSEEAQSTWRTNTINNSIPSSITIRIQSSYVYF